MPLKCPCLYKVNYVSWLQRHKRSFTPSASMTSGQLQQLMKGESVASKMMHRYSTHHLNIKVSKYLAGFRHISLNRKWISAEVTRQHIKTFHCSNLTGISVLVMICLAVCCIWQLPLWLQTRTRKGRRLGSIQSFCCLSQWKHVTVNGSMTRMLCLQS